MPLKDLDSKSWRRRDGNTTYLVSTSPVLLDSNFINTAFGSDEMFWAKPLEPELLATLLSNSVTLGLYKVLSRELEPKTIDETSSPSSDAAPEEKLDQVGLARFVTDHVSTAYLTDVYVLPEYRKHGLGKWLIACCKEILEDHPALRRAFLVASAGPGQQFYAKELGFWNVYEERERLAIMTTRR